MSLSCVCVLFLFSAAVLIGADVDTDGDANEFSEAERVFGLHVKPLLVDKCFSCHGNGPAKIKGGLNLLTRESMLKGGESSDAVLVPGDAAGSSLYRAVTREDPELEMPPKENDRLTEEQVLWVRDWIDGGAPWPDDSRMARIRDEFAEGTVVETSGGLTPEWNERRYRDEDLWAYRPLWLNPANPANQDDSGASSVSEESGVDGENDWVDRLVDDRMAAMGVPPAPEADRRSLIRRATYDLTGLPPSDREVSDFLEDPAPDGVAFMAVVERLLDSPHYGEHWGRHWLDVVRYADSSGFANDYQRGNTWRYRDYVVRAFNEDKPYDRFVREQVAGDELYDASAGEDSDRIRDPDLLVAAGFLRMGPWELTGMEVARVARQRFLDDVTDSVGQVFLAHPLQCARCHDHKFDPIPTRDYYRMQALFNTTQLVEREAPFSPDENTGGFEERHVLEGRKKRFEHRLTALGAKEEAAAKAWAAERGLDYIPRSRGLREGISEALLPPRKIGFDVEDFGLERISRKGLERLGWELDRYRPVAFSVYSGATPVRNSVKAPTRVPADRLKGVIEAASILTGGDPFAPADPVRPGVMSVLNGFNPGLETVTVPESVAGRRTALAEWLTHRSNPLPARVMVNRIWQWHFGRGIAGNPNNFGATGGKPSHPVLLDRLAREFVESGWSIKHMHRIIMGSRAYRRSAHHPDRETLHRRDPTGTSYAVFRPRRLTAEELRDSMLAVTGELNRTIGGIPNRPEIHLEAALQPRMVMGTFAAAWQPNPLPEQRHRRSLYALKIRGLRDPFMEVFNEPPSDSSCESRESSAVTPQVFSLFNGQSTYQRAVAFALRLLAESGVDTADTVVPRPEVVDRAFRLAFGRVPIPKEREASLAHWQSMAERHRATTLTPTAYPAVVEREAVEENTGEKFTFREVLDFYDGFVPDKTMADTPATTRGLAELCLVLFNTNEFIYVY